MDNRRPTLPLLLDFNLQSPDQVPKVITKRPATTANFIPHPHTFPSQTFTSSTNIKPNSLGQTKKSPWSKNIDGHKLFKEKEIQRIGSPDFGSKIQKPLPKLYSDCQHETLSHKLRNLKEKYEHLYGRIIDLPEEQIASITQENFKELLLEAEKMFSATYSVQYFGVRDDELGILSKRFPITKVPCRLPDSVKHVLKTQSISQTPHSHMRQDKPNHRQTMSQQNSKAHNKENVSYHSPDMEGKGNKLTFSAPTGDLMAEEGLQSFEKEEDKQNKKEGVSEEERNKLSVHGKKDLYKNKGSMSKRGDHKFEPASSRARSTDYTGARNKINSNGEGQTYNEVPKNMNPEYAERRRDLNKASEYMENKNPYIVTKYLIPKKLQTFRSKAKNNIKQSMSQTHRNFEIKGGAAERTTEDGQNGGNNNVAKTHRISREQQEYQQTGPKIQSSRNQQELNEANFERKLVSMQKVKRSILRNVHVDKAWNARGYKDELDIPEKFRTYEVNKVLADNAKYSYAKLLETMNTQERPETALIENAEKIEKMLAIREVKKKILGEGKGTPEYEADRRNYLGSYVVKVCYPRENEMFNRFWKIKANVEHEEEDAQQ